MNQLVKVAAGTAFSMSFMAIAYVVVAKYVMREIGDMSQELVHRNHQRIEQHNAKLAYEEQQKKEIAQRKAEQAAHIETLARRKEAAWLKWYKEPDGCQSYSSNQHMVECINHKMRSKKEFERLWLINPSL